MKVQALWLSNYLCVADNTERDSLDGESPIDDFEMLIDDVANQVDICMDTLELFADE